MLSEEIAELRNEREERAKHEKTDDNATCHLRMAQATLTERYSKLEEENVELQERLDQTMKLVLAFVVTLCIVITRVKRTVSVAIFQLYLG